MLRDWPLGMSRLKPLLASNPAWDRFELLRRRLASETLKSHHKPPQVNVN